MPHVDSVKFVGRGLGTVSLLSDAIMRFRPTNDPDEYVDCLIPRYSLYCMENEARYDFTHELLHDDESCINNVKVPRKRRISIITRVQPELNPDVLFDTGFE